MTVGLPAVGLGTHGIAEGAIESALRAGYRLIDTAVSYGNEEQVGAELRASGIERERVQIVTKLAGRDHGFRETFAACRASLRRLGLTYLDLYLIHWPNPHLDRYVDSWRAMIELRELGLVRAIGVSNFTERHLTRLVSETGEAPAVNQIELHPAWRQDGLRSVHAGLGIATMAWSPLGRLATEVPPAVARIAGERGWSPQQVVLGWHAGIGSVPVPRSSHPARQAENLTVHDTLTAHELAAIADLPQERLWDADPESFRDW
ncbi:MAG TPA: aldo/keto reductase [Pseudolysinimonas sp.]|nr:aldo/keto reductase [Pseudolysinimonas sp.]